MKVRLPKNAKQNIEASEDVYKIMHAVLMRQTKLRRRKEYFWCIGLNAAADLLYIELISIGSQKTAPAEPTEMFWLATNKKSTSIILVHNHTGSKATPSTLDLKLTDRLIEGGKILGIEIVDHIIITEKHGYYSMKDEGLI